MKKKGQLSLEYLLLLLASFSVFAMLFPLLNNVYQAALFGFDSANARSFTALLQNSVNEMSFQADGSRHFVSAHPSSNWKISCLGKILSVEVAGPESKKKQFRVLFPNELKELNLAIEKQTDFLLEKSSGKITLVHN